MAPCEVAPLGDAVLVEARGILRLSLVVAVGDVQGRQPRGEGRPGHPEHLHPRPALAVDQDRPGLRGGLLAGDEPGRKASTLGRVGHLRDLGSERVLRVVREGDQVDLGPRPVGRRLPDDNLEPAYDASVGLRDDRAGHPAVATLPLQAVRRGRAEHPHLARLSRADAHRASRRGEGQVALDRVGLHLEPVGADPTGEVPRTARVEDQQRGGERRRASRRSHRSRGSPAEFFVGLTRASQHLL